MMSTAGLILEMLLPIILSFGPFYMVHISNYNSSFEGSPREKAGGGGEDVTHNLEIPI